MKIYHPFLLMLFNTLDKVVVVFLFKTFCNFIDFSGGKTLRRRKQLHGFAFMLLFRKQILYRAISV